MNLENERSRFGSNLFFQFLLWIVLLVAAFSLPVPANVVVRQISVFVSWSFWIGLFYGVFRAFGARVDPLERYYQNFPIGLRTGMTDGFRRPGEPLSATTRAQNPDLAATSPISKSQEAPVDFKWEWLFSPEYLRYAGWLLIISAVFALLFRIEWSLINKIIATFLGAGLAMAGSEAAFRRSRKELAASLFLAAFGLLQFGCTLVFKYFHEGSDQSGMLAQVETWLVLKSIIAAGAMLTIGRFGTRFAPIVVLLIAYLTPGSLVRIGQPLPISFSIGFVVFMSFVGLGYGVLHSLHSAFIANLVGACSYFLTLCRHTNNSELLSRAFTQPLDPDLEQVNQSVFIALFVILVLQVAASAFAAWEQWREKSKEDTVQLTRRPTPELDGHETMAVTDIVTTQVFGSIALLTLQAQVPGLAGYYGLTLLGFSLVSLVAYFSLRLKLINNVYTEVLFNTALLVSAAGLFLNTKGAWSALVFLVFSCFAVYGSFALGTIRTRVYAFGILTVSMFKLYFESSELFDSIPATVIIGVVGVALVGISHTVNASREPKEG